MMSLLELEAGPLGDVVLICRRAVSEVRRAGELTLPLTNCSTLQSGPYTSPGQHSRADPGGA
ncbi:hypothetical protein STEG23_027399, partial [Scotinomys teguina]